MDSPPKDRLPLLVRTPADLKLLHTATVEIGLCLVVVYDPVAPPETEYPRPFVPSGAPAPSPRRTKGGRPRKHPCPPGVSSEEYQRFCTARLMDCKAGRPMRTWEEYQQRRRRSTPAPA